MSRYTVIALERGRELPRDGTVELLADALGLSPEERAALESAATAAVAAGRRRPDNLPLYPTPFIGREQEVTDVSRLLGQRQFVTLTGPAGVGKTRLAVETARGQVLLARDGVWLVELAPLADPALVPQAVAAACGVDLEPGDGHTSGLVDALGPLRLVLLLDNCEHLAAATAALVDAVLRYCPHVRVLATSREPLGCQGEAVWPVSPFGLPPAADTVAPEVDNLLRYDAVRLFVDRANAALPDFALTEWNAWAVADICRRLDGLPLAVELAAARVRVLAVKQIAARLNDRFRLLTRGGRTASRQQLSLRAAVDWSYELLSPEEQSLFARLSVFAGVFTLEAVEAVCAEGPGAVRDPTPATTPPQAVADVLDLLLRLVDKSLVSRVAGADGGGPRIYALGPGTDGGRYLLLETLREYGRERLLATGEAAPLHRRLLDHYLGLVERETEEAADLPAERLHRLEAERENLWAALRWARDSADTECDRRLREVLSGLVSRLASPAVRQAVAPLIFEMRRLALPAYAHLEQSLLQQTDPSVLDAAELYRVIGDWEAESAVRRRRVEIEQDEAARARAQMQYARPLLYRKDARKATALLEEVVQTATEHNDDLLLLDALLEAGFAYAEVGDCFRGRDAYARALALLERLRPRLGEAIHQTKRLAALHGKGCVEHNADDNAACVASFKAALGVAKAVGDEPQAVLNQTDLADAQWGCWRYSEALQTYGEAAAASETACSTEGREFCLLGRGIVLWSIGQLTAAATALREGLGVARDVGDVWGTAYGLTYLSAVQASSGELSAALRTSQEAADLAASLGAEYLLTLARLYYLWQREVEAPGDPTRGPQIEEAKEQARGLGLDGLELHVRWLRLLHDVADPAVPDVRLLERLQSEVDAFPFHRPGRGTWEVLGLQVVRAFGLHRPAVDPTAVRALEALITRVTELKASSLASMPERQATFLETRRPWVAP
jgi:predicted ATPase